MTVRLSLFHFNANPPVSVKTFKWGQFRGSKLFLGSIEQFHRDECWMCLGNRLLCGRKKSEPIQLALLFLSDFSFLCFFFTYQWVHERAIYKQEKEARGKQRLSAPTMPLLGIRDVFFLLESLPSLPQHNTSEVSALDLAVWEIWAGGCN